MGKVWQMEGDIGEDRVAQNHLLSCIAHGPVGLPNADEMAERAGQPVTRRQITFLHSSLPLHIRETHQTCQWGGNPSGAIVLSSHVAGWETLSKIIFLVEDRSRFVQIEQSRATYRIRVSHE